MANEEQLRILKEEGVKAWNRWRENNPDKIVDLSEAELVWQDLRQADLKGADLSKANLRQADLKGADLSRKKLRQADLKGGDPSKANLRQADVIKPKNFTRIDIMRGDFSRASLIEADLIGAYLTGADLTGAVLIATQALGTNFENAILTGACIENWNINSETNLEGVICDYIYLKRGQQERRPSDPNSNFEPGEFTKLVEQSIETVDIIFKDGIDWRAFLTSFQDLRVEYGEQNVSIQAIEKKSDGAFVIRLNVPPEADKAEVESYAKQSYQNEIQVLKTENRSLLRENANLNNIVYTLANRPIMNFDQRGSNIGINQMIGGEIKDNAKVAGNMNVYASEQKQTLADAAAEIQKLLQQLEQTNPDATPEQKEAYVNAAIPPTIKERCINALIAGGETAIDEFFDNPFMNVGKAIVMAWIQP